MSSIMILLALVGGAMLSMQAAINGRLGSQVGVFRSAFLTFAVGGVITALLIFYFEPRQVVTLLDVPKWQLLGAFCGEPYIVIMVLAVQRIGTATATVAVIFGQLTMSLLIDNFGWLGNDANHGRVVRLLKEVPPVAGKNIYLTLDLHLHLHLQQYIESVLKGQRAAVVAVDPRDGGVLAMVSSPSYDPNPFVRGIGYQAYRSLLDNPDRPLINRVTQGLYPPASTVKPYMALSALSAGVITPTTSFFGAPTWTLPGTQRRYRDWLKSGHGMLNVTKAIEESADTFFYQVAFEMGIDRIHEWLSKFGYGQSTGIDLNEEYAGVLPSREWKQRVHKKPWYQGDTISVGIGQGYWIATPIQMVKALTTLINNGKVQNPHLLYSMKQGNKVERYQPPQNLPQVGDPHSPYWSVVRNGMYGMANLPNGTGYKLFHTAPYQIAAKSGTSQVFSLKENQTYNAKMIPVRLRDHIFYTLFAPYQHPKVAMALILENGGGDGVVAGPTARAILDHIFDPANVPAAQGAQSTVPQVDSADAQ